MGTWTFVSDSDGSTADTGTAISLTFSVGSVAFAAVGPGQNVTDHGTWSIYGSRISINLPAIGKSASNQPFTLAVNSLTLPFKVFSGGAGTSTWIRLQTPSNKGNSGGSNASGGSAAAGGSSAAGGSAGGSGSGGGGSSGGSSGSSGNSGNSGNANSSSNNSGNSGNGNNSNSSNNSNNSNNSHSSNNSSNSNSSNNSNSPNNANNSNNPNNPNNPGHGKPGTVPPPGVDPRIAPYVGDWVGQGWSWETRFRQSRRDFTSQLTGGRLDALGDRSKVQGNVMEVAVEHDTEFSFTIDPKGVVKGYGGIVYNVSPNLCGLAALTKQVNEAINIMSKLPAIYKFANEIGTAYVDTMNKEWYEHENELSKSMDELKTVEHRAEMAGRRYAATSGEGEKELEKDAAKALDDMKASKEAKRLAYDTILTRCSSGTSYKISGGLPCDLVAIPPSEKAKIQELGEVLKDKGKELLKEMKEFEKERKEKYEELNAIERESASTCGSVGPTNGHQFFELMRGKFFAAIKENYKNPEGLVGALANIMLEIPGITQVTYQYKGLQNGPEQRDYNITGYLQPGNPPLLHLRMDGDPTGGSTDLTVTYMVNYKWDKGRFPVWTPFLSQPGEVHSSGSFVMPPEHGENGAPAGPGEKVSFTTPYAVFHETGTHRNNVKPWQEYEYFWFAHKVTEPAWVPEK